MADVPVGVAVAGLPPKGSSARPRHWNPSRRQSPDLVTTLMVNAHVSAVLGRVASAPDLNLLHRFDIGRAGVLVMRLFTILMPSSERLLWISRVPAPTKSTPGGVPVSEDFGPRRNPGRRNGEPHRIAAI